MPREAKVSVSDAVEVVKVFILMEHFVDNNFSIKSAEVWQQISLRLGGRWNARNVYREVREDQLLIYNI